MPCLSAPCGLLCTRPGRGVNSALPVPALEPFWGRPVFLVLDSGLLTPRLLDRRRVQTAVGRNCRLHTSNDQPPLVSCALRRPLVRSFLRLPIHTHATHTHTHTVFLPLASLLRWLMPPLHPVCLRLRCVDSSAHALRIVSALERLCPVCLSPFTALCPPLRTACLNGQSTAVGSTTINRHR